MSVSGKNGTPVQAEASRPGSTTAGNQSRTRADELMQAGRYLDAAAVLEDVLGDGTATGEDMNRLGTAYTMGGEVEKAVAAYAKAVELAPRFAAAWCNLGTALQFSGSQGDALAAYHRALDVEPGLDCLYHLAQCKTFRPGDADLARMEQKLACGRFRNVEDEFDLRFALAKAHDDLGSHDKAFEHLERANRLKRGTFSYSIEAEEQRAERVLAAFGRDFTRRYRNTGDQSAAPIFIVGMPRSGTTLVEQILSSHSRVAAGGELPFLPAIAAELGHRWSARGESFRLDDEVTVRKDLDEVAAAYFSATARLSATSEYFTDKLPQNFLYVGLIAAAFPRGRIVHCRRDALDVCLSCYQRLFAGGQEFSYDLTELGRYYRLYRHAMEEWRKLLGDRLIEVDYEQLVSDTETSIRKLVSFCGLPWEDICLEFHKNRRSVTTASANQVRRPVYRSAVGRWRNYARHLEPLKRQLREKDRAS